MPTLMDEMEWATTLECAKRSNRVWRQRVVGHAGEDLLSLPESGSFDVIFVAISPPSPSGKSPCKTSAKDMIGFGKRFHTPRPTEEWMKELRG